ncbi:hypothetical protein Y032_0027g1560 [Ancylostoma ceylanicum]|uniref:Uncharacterized protein n=1 Tax=Ancylostoma ceylanicum TaxID=53326 RepID=A0A016USW3_9BILA|nr:hypothetical protein Y032_0027g1560 [Ancylostoma ceylanicum]
MWNSRIRQWIPTTAEVTTSELLCTTSRVTLQRSDVGRASTVMSSKFTSTAILSRKKRHTSYVQVLQLEKLSQCFVFERAALEHVGERDART